MNNATFRDFVCGVVLAIVPGSILFLYLTNQFSLAGGL